MKRHKIGKRQSRKNFSRHASHVHRKNIPGSAVVMRGGIRL